MSTGTRKILLVEDNPGDVVLIEEALRFQAFEYELKHCETIEAALQAISHYQIDHANAPDLLLLDYNLPGGDARTVIRAALSNPALTGTRIAVITSSLSPRDRDDALRSGAECFIYKPPDLDSFLNEVGSAISNLLLRTRTVAQ